MKTKQQEMLNYLRICEPLGIYSSRTGLKQVYGNYYKTILLRLRAEGHDIRNIRVNGVSFVYIVTQKNKVSFGEKLVYVLMFISALALCRTILR